MNYDHISEALSHYGSYGYEYRKDAPWYVGRQAYYATKPPGAPDILILPEDRYMVASGEQSFLQMLLGGERLPRAMCITPCFRIEDYDELHRPYFMKVELIVTYGVVPSQLHEMIECANNFFEGYLDTSVVQTGPQAFDIVSKVGGIELGSYGIREVLGFRYIYGTGCAEPRLSYTMDKVQR